MKGFFVWGGWEGHEPRQCVDIFAPFSRNRFDVESCGNECTEREEYSSPLSAT